MSENPRCRGSGTCIIDNEGRCWCGQQWDGQKMCHAPLSLADVPGRAASTATPALPEGSVRGARVLLRFDRHPGPIRRRHRLHGHGARPALATARRNVHFRDREGRLWMATDVLDWQASAGRRISGCVVVADSGKSKT